MYNRSLFGPQHFQRFNGPQIYKISNLEPQTSGGFLNSVCQTSGGGFSNQEWRLLIVICIIIIIITTIIILIIYHIVLSYYFNSFSPDSPRSVRAMAPPRLPLAEASLAKRERGGGCLARDAKPATLDPEIPEIRRHSRRRAPRGLAARWAVPGCPGRSACLATWLAWRLPSCLPGCLPEPPARAACPAACPAGRPPTCVHVLVAPTYRTSHAASVPAKNSTARGPGVWIHHTKGLASTPSTPTSRHKYINSYYI